MVGNHVLLRCGPADILLAHMMRGSLIVTPGDAVQEGDLLGRVGNSGNSSAPHLHFHAQRRGTPEAPFSGTPLPMRFDGKFPVRGSRL
jgi:murein DD-endopeptidase MepM/ murein hydrolase activator NlpD